MCPECGLKITSYDQYSSHKTSKCNLETRVTVGPLLCPKCTYVTNKTQVMTYHLHCHDLDKSYRCKGCDYLAAQHWSINKHRRFCEALDDVGETGKEFHAFKVAKSISQCDIMQNTTFGAQQVITIAFNLHLEL